MYVVFDLDGTLALNEHRVHHIRKHPRDYDAFFAACVDDKLCVPVLRALEAHLTAFHRVEIWSGRSDQVLAETIAWLEHHGIHPGLLARMRRAGDHRPDIELKREWLRAAQASGSAPDLVYDDRDCVVAMWRAEGVACFQVAPGPF